MITLRPPRPEEAAAMSDLCLRSKAVWGYDEAFMAACVEELTVTVEAITSSHFQIAEDDNGIVGVVQVEVRDKEAELELMYVSPDRLGTGAGRALFQWARDKAHSLGADRMIIVADPHAVAFYEHMGASRIGDYPSGSIPGRMLPQLAMSLSS